MKKYILNLFFFLLGILIYITFFISFVSADWTTNLNEEIRSYYTMDELSGTRYDSLGSFNATSDGGLVYTSLGRINGAIRGDSAHQLGVGNVLGNLNNITISFWIKKDGTSMPNYRFMGDAEDFNVNFADCSQVNANKITVTMKGQCIDPNWINIGDNNWHHLVISADGSTRNVKFYKDDILTSDIFLAQPFNNLADNLCFLTYSCGTTPSDSSFYLDEIGIWKRTLSISEVDQLYNNSNGLSFSSSNISQPPPPPPSPDIVANLTMRIDNLTVRMDQLEQQIGLLETWKNITDTIINTLQQSMITVLNTLSNHEQRITNLENKTSINYFKYLDATERKNIVCSYAKDVNLTNYADLGWSCSLTYKPLKKGGESLTCECVSQ